MRHGLLLIALFLTTSGCMGHGLPKANVADVKHLYIFKDSDLLALAQRYGYRGQDVQGWVHSNAAGTEVEIREWTGGRDGRVFRFARGQEAPEILHSFGDLRTQMPDGTLVSIEQFHVRTEEAMERTSVWKPAGSALIWDRSVRYAVCDDPTSGTLAIASLDPNGPTGEFPNARWQPTGLASHPDGRVYLFGQGIGSDDRYICWVLQPDGHGLRKVREFDLPAAAYGITDVDCEWVCVTKEVLPLAWQKGVYNLETGAYADLGFLQHKTAMFLADDWLKQRLAQMKNGR